MSDNAPKRLSKVAKELNIATTTILEFLKSKNISIEDNPNAKILPEHYDILLVKFQTDKLSKEIIDEKKEEVKKEEKAKKQEIQQEDKEDILIKSNLIKREATIKEKPIVKSEIKEEKKEEPEIEFKIVGKIDLQEIEKEPEVEKEQDKEINLAQEVEILTENEKFEEEIIITDEPEPVIITQEIQKEEEPIDIKEEEPEEVVAQLEKNDDDFAIEISEEETKEEEKQDNLIIAQRHDPNEEVGLKILGKIDMEQFNAPKKKVPIVSTSDISSFKQKKRKRIFKSEKGESDKESTSENKKVKEKGKKKLEPKKPEVDQKEIKEQISATLAKLTGKPTSSVKTKIKKLKRKEIKDKEQALSEEEKTNVLEVIEFITVNELANLMQVPVSDVITVCMNLGLMVNINQRLDAESITFVADEFNYEVIFKHDSTNEPSLEESDNVERMIERAPVVTIMGHVDHGKTTLLDYIRKTKVTEGEAGGITQHIGAYYVTLPNGKNITFLDTPGHEAFTSMRARGAKVTDVAIIVVSADDNVMPQTKEAISHAQAAGVKIVFAINKVDKDGANPEKIREQLSEMNILVEEWGGKYQSQEISAKKGLNVDKLLEKVLLEAEMLELKADPEKRAIGTVIEASMDKGRGVVATILVQKGKLKVGDSIVAGAYYGKVKAMFDQNRKRTNDAGPSFPVEVLGFDGPPTAGDVFYVTENDQIAKEVANHRKRLIREQGIRATKHVTLDEIGRRIALGNFRELNVIIKADFDGSVEALSDSVQKLSTEEVQVNVIHKGVGQISESDVLLASASDAIIIGFQVRPSMNARRLAEQEQIDIRLYSIIYDAIEEIKAAIEGMLQPTEEEKILCNVEVREVYRISKVGNIAGCFVLEGKINRNTKVRIVREGVVVYTGELASLKRFKDDVKEVSSGYECGIGIQNFNDLKVGDIIEGYIIEKTKRKL